jgi:hypothetical protein
MGCCGVDDESEYFLAIEDEPAEDDLDADFDDGSDGDKKTSTKTLIKTSIQGDCQQPRGTHGECFETPPRMDEIEDSKGYSNKIPKKPAVAHVAHSLGNDYSKLVASSCTIAESIRFKTRMDMLMKEAEMYFRFGDKDKAIEAMAQARQLRKLEEAKDDHDAKDDHESQSLSRPSTPQMQTNSPELPPYTFVPVVQLPDDAVNAEEDEIPCPNTPVIV